MNLSIFKKTLMLAAAAVLYTAASASAATITYDFTSDHCTGGCIGTDGIGTVTLTDDGAGNVDVTVSIDPNYYVSTGSGDGYYFKFSLGSGYDGSSITGLNPDLKSVYDPLTLLDGDGTGHFNFGITCNPCGPGNDPYTSDITFTVLNASTTSFTTNDLGILFVADVYSIQTQNTGPVDITPVPDGGSTMMLLGSALVGFGLLRRRLQS